MDENGTFVDEWHLLRMVILHGYGRLPDAIFVV